MIKKIKPCPSCGAVAYLTVSSIYDDDNDESRLIYRVECPKCGVKGYYQEYTTDAINSWNDGEGYVYLENIKED